MLHRPSSRQAHQREQRRQRNRRLRARRKACRIAVTIEVDAAVIRFLVRLRWLDEKLAADRREVGKAITRMFAYAAAMEIDKVD
jgi:hypothetical protein